MKFRGFCNIIAMVAIIVSIGGCAASTGGNPFDKVELVGQEKWDQEDWKMAVQTEVDRLAPGLDIEVEEVYQQPSVLPTPDPIYGHMWYVRAVTGDAAYYANLTEYDAKGNKRLETEAEVMKYIAGNVVEHFTIPEGK